MSAGTAPDFWTSIFRGWRGRCPRCGAGSLFSSFLKMQSNCPSCGLAFEPFRADDAPAYFTILAVGHIVVPMVLAFEKYGNQPPLWAHALLWLPLSVGARPAAPAAHQGRGNRTAVDPECCDAKAHNRGSSSPFLTVAARQSPVLWSSLIS